jgi:DNA-binding IclR family transcriptional regulator
MLRALEAPDGLSQADIADRLGLPRSTVHRILNALERERLVAVSSPRGRHRLGPEITRLARRRGEATSPGCARTSSSCPAN